MKGYKVFNPNWTTANSFRWKVGETYEHDGKLEICESGFHFCKNPVDCFRYYSFNPKNKVAEIEALGNIKEDTTKCVTDKIKIVREIPWKEVLTLVNMGQRNDGHHNSGDFNTGDFNGGSYNGGSYNLGYCNTGDINMGKYNTGDKNRGNYNVGDHNTGDHNVGCNNSGNWNTGEFNTGHCNTGNFNACTRSTGFFNTESSKIYMFNKPCDLTWKEILRLSGMQILQKLSLYDLTEWIPIYGMTDEEKTAHPEYTVTDGYLKCKDFKDTFKEFWQELSSADRQEIMKLPNFDPAIFKEITSIDVTEDYTDNN